MSVSAIALDSIVAAAHLPTFNGLTNAVSAAALFGVNQRLTNGLRLTLYGGNFPTDAGPVAIATQSFNLTPSATNYVYANDIGVVTVTTVLPSGWPGPLSGGQRALYTLVVGANSITSGTNYLVGQRTKGATGSTGPTGIAGAELYQQRLRMSDSPGDGSTTIENIDFVTTLSGSAVSRTVGWGSAYSQKIPQVAITSGDLRNSNNLYFLGNAAGRGGFTISMRWTLDTSFGHAGQRSFYGLYDITPGTIGNTEPSTLVNLIGIGNDAADSTLSVIHNDGSGSATKTTITSNDSPTVTFAAHNVDVIYELVLTSQPNSGTVQWSLSSYDGTVNHTASGTISSNLPANTQFLTWIMSTNVGTAGGTTTFNFIQCIGNSRY